MSHRSRIVRVLSNKDSGKLPRTVLEGLARTPRDKAAASALIDYLIAHGDLVKHGDSRGTTYGLARRKAA